MMDLRDHALKLQRIESDAMEKAGLRMRLLDEAALAKGGKDYAREFTEMVLADIGEEVKAAAALGVELGDAINKAKAKKAEEVR